MTHSYSWYITVVRAVLIVLLEVVAIVVVVRTSTFTSYWNICTTCPNSICRN